MWSKSRFNRSISSSDKRQFEFTYVMCPLSHKMFSFFHSYKHHNSSLKILVLCFITFNQPQLLLWILFVIHQCRFQHITCPKKVNFYLLNTAEYAVCFLSLSFFWCMCCAFSALLYWSFHGCQYDKTHSARGCFTLVHGKRKVASDPESTVIWKIPKHTLVQLHSDSRQRRDM